MRFPYGKHAASGYLHIINELRKSISGRHVPGSLASTEWRVLGSGNYIQGYIRISVSLRILLFGYHTWRGHDYSGLLHSICIITSKCHL